MTEKILTPAMIIAAEFNIKLARVQAAINLIDDGATIPFIARYRKEATEGLNDIELRHIAERLIYLRELNARRLFILKTIKEQGQLSTELNSAILATTNKTHLEDFYLPYKPKRHSKAALAKEAGLMPLALLLLQNPQYEPQKEAVAFLNPHANITDVDAALEGAKQILIERFAETAQLNYELREYLWQHALLTAIKVNQQKNATTKFSDYFNYAEPIKKIPSHRALALLRGKNEKVLRLSISLAESDLYPQQHIASFYQIADENRPADHWLLNIVHMAWRTKLFVKLEFELLSRLRELADQEAINVFAHNLHNLLLAAPAGAAVTIGLDPGIRTGIKVAVVDQTGKLLDYLTIFPFPPQREWEESIIQLAKLINKYNVSLCAIGNGTGSRETELLVKELIVRYPDLNLVKVIVNEAGASVYSASELAANELPDLDVSLRGAVSIARRLQDPLAELVKIEPKAIGVGQYQHDVNQKRLTQSLTNVVEDCVNAVGVNLNTASAALLSYVAGLNKALAQNLIEYRNEHGAFSNRQQLKNVARMGDHAFQQAAGFLRILNGDQALDATAVHPESYALVEKILADYSMNIRDAIGNHEFVQSINSEKYIDNNYGLPTINGILRELDKPGQDPRKEFKTVEFNKDLNKLQDLKEGMILEGVVANVTSFGAFVNIGVHQDGLIHISAMTKNFITDPHKVLKTGDIVTVQVTKVDQERHRISLKMHYAMENNSKDLAKEMPKTIPRVSNRHNIKKLKNVRRQPVNNKMKERVVKKNSQLKKVIFNTAMADALAKLKKNY